MLPQLKVFSKNQKKWSSPVLLPFVLIVALLVHPKWSAQTDEPLVVTIGFKYCNFLSTAFSVA